MLDGNREEGEELTVEYHLKVRFGDTDAAGIVFYPNFYKWMDEATHEYFTAIGFPTSILKREQNIATPLLEAHCVFKSALFFEDEIKVISEVVEVRGKVFKLSHQFVRGDQIVAEGYEVRAWTSFEGKPKALPIPDEVKCKMMPEGEKVVKN